MLISTVAWGTPAGMGKKCGGRVGNCCTNSEGRVGNRHNGRARVKKSIAVPGCVPTSNTYIGR
jgi:hypothetical protein